MYTPIFIFSVQFTFFLDIEVKSLSSVFCKFEDSQFVSTKSMSKLAKYWSSIPSFNFLLSPDTFNVTHLIYILPQGSSPLWQETTFVNSISTIDVLHIVSLETPDRLTGPPMVILLPFGLLLIFISVDNGLISTTLLTQEESGSSVFE